MEKIDYFKREINYIKNESHQKDLIYLINNLPDYFFEIPASSTGKYHPDYARSEHGLVKHTKVVCRICYELLNNPIIGGKYTDNEKDLLLIATLLHDGLKSGFDHEKYTRFDHPILAANYVRDNMDNLELSDEEIEFVAEAIETHMGPWTTDYNGEEVLSPPKTKYQNLVHMCDYLASKKFINVNFDENIDIEG